MKLQKLKEFILLRTEDLESANLPLFKEELEIIKKYTEFLDKKLHLGMFIPCNENNEKLEYPTCNWCNTGTPGDCHRSKECAIDEKPFCNYEKALERIVFRNHSFVKEDDYNWIFMNNHKKIEIPKNACVEFLIIEGYDTELTEFASKLIFG